MFNIGFSEMILISVVALLFLPPEKLPDIATKLGRFIGQLNHSFNDIKSSMEKGMRAEMNQIKTNLPPLPQLSKQLKNEPSTTKPDKPTDVDQPPR
ncbi:MAG: hypothetical protein ACD_73C00630G0001 [uncultured bacterium]|nr:MAG: hypothetical protein ACD_73C00630G0001 [uncultured bacterium]